MAPDGRALGRTISTDIARETSVGATTDPSPWNKTGEDGNGSSKRSRFCLKRQDCLEKGEPDQQDRSPKPEKDPSQPTDTAATVPLHTMEVPICGGPLKSPPTSPATSPYLVKSPAGSPQSKPSPGSMQTMASADPSTSEPEQHQVQQPEPPRAPQAHTTPILAKQRSASTLGREHHLQQTLPPLLPKPPPYSPSRPHSPHASVIYHGGPTASGMPALQQHPKAEKLQQRPTPSAGASVSYQLPHKISLPSVRIIPDDNDGGGDLDVGDVVFCRSHDDDVDDDTDRRPKASPSGTSVAVEEGAIGIKTPLPMSSTLPVSGHRDLQHPTRNFRPSMTEPIPFDQLIPHQQLQQLPLQLQHQHHPHQQPQQPTSPHLHQQQASQHRHHLEQQQLHQQQFQLQEPQSQLQQSHLQQDLLLQQQMHPQHQSPAIFDRSFTSPFSLEHFRGESLMGSPNVAAAAGRGSVQGSSYEVSE